MPEDYGLTEETLAADGLVSEHPAVLIPVTIAAGAGILAKGTVLGKITSSGEYVAYDDDNNDGSQTAVCILARSVVATSAAVLASATVHGSFKRSGLTGLDDAAEADLFGRIWFA
jgi:hypothetical protein